MPCFNDAYWSATQLEALQKIIACEHLSVVSKQSGGNSVVYGVSADDKLYAVKLYPPYTPGGRDRLASELAVYQFFLQQQVSMVPQLRAYCEQKRWLIIDWIDGIHLETYTPGHIQQALDFIQLTANLSQTQAAAVLPQAAEPCLSLQGLIAQIQQRLKRLLNQSDDKSLHIFLLNEFKTAFSELHKRAIQGYKTLGLPVDCALSEDNWALIPADFGFHNILCTSAGQFYFFDFDYFGWDDPVKLLSDILWHPKMTLTDGQKKQFIAGFSTIFSSDALFSQRFDYHFPLFGLRWVLILLNEFIAEFWQNRQHARVYDDRAVAKTAQLQRAHALLEAVQQQTGCFA